MWREMRRFPLEELVKNWKFLVTLLSHKRGPVSWNRSDARIVTHRIQLNVRERESETCEGIYGEGDSSNVFIMSVSVCVCVCVCVCVHVCVCVCVRACVWLIFLLLLLLLVPVDGKRRVSLSSQRIPLLLECGHSYRSLCVQKMSHLQSSDLPCPQCRVRREKERGREGERGGDESLLCYMYKYM